MAAIRSNRRKRRQTPDNASAGLATLAISADTLQPEGLGSRVVCWVNSSEVTIDAAMVAANWRLWAYENVGMAYAVLTPSGVHSVTPLGDGVKIELDFTEGTDDSQVWSLIIPVVNSGVAGRFGQAPNCSSGQFISGQYVLAGEFLF